MALCNSVQVKLNLLESPHPLIAVCPPTLMCTHFLPSCPPFNYTLHSSLTSYLTHFWVLVSFFSSPFTLSHLPLYSYAARSTEYFQHFLSFIPVIYRVQYFVSEVLRWPLGGGGIPKFKTKIRTLEMGEATDHSSYHKSSATEVKSRVILGFVI